MLVGKIIHHSGHRILLMKAEAFHLRNVMLKSDLDRANPPIRRKFFLHVDPHSLKHHMRYGMGSTAFNPFHSLFTAPCSLTADRISDLRMVATLKVGFDIGL